MTDAAAGSQSVDDDSSSDGSPPFDADALWKPGSADTVASDAPTISATKRELVEEPGSSIWSSGSGAVFVSPSAPVFDGGGAIDAPGSSEGTQTADPSAGEPETDDEVVARSRPRPRWTVVFIMAAVAVVVAIVVRSMSTTDLTADVSSRPATGTDDDAADVIPAETIPPLVTESFVGADPRRLPDRLDQRWRTDVPGVSATGRTELTVRDDGAVIGVFDDGTVAGGTVDDGTVDGGQAASFVALFDAVDGSEQWRTPFDSQASAFDVLGIFADVIVLERLDTDNRSVLGISDATGQVLWVRETNDPGVHVALEGTAVVARVTFTVSARLTFIDPATGDEVGRVPGRLFATDHRGTWYVRNGAMVSKLDLRDGWNPPTPFGSLWVDDDDPASVIGERLIVIDGGRLEVRGDDGGGHGVNVIGVGAPGFGAVDAGADFTQLLPMVGDSLVAVRARSVLGAELDENGDVDVRWRALGTPIESVSTERGLALVVATDGGGSQSVIDASTGDEIVAIQMVAGAIDTLQLVGNGVVVKESALVGFERVGLDLDGNRLWALGGEGPVAVGAGVVVTFEPSDAGIAITAYGDATP